MLLKDNQQSLPAITIHTVHEGFLLIFQQLYILAILRPAENRTAKNSFNFFENNYTGRRKSFATTILLFIMNFSRAQGKGINIFSHFPSNTFSTGHIAEFKIYKITKSVII